ncbi:MAG: PAS domain S-box protein [Oligoflexia bacterium]|nr:PAS domain S-box protein [Oligoflexia bacterium]
MNTIANNFTEPDYRLLFQKSSELFLIITATPDFTIVAVRDGYLDATMTTNEKVVGRPIFDVFPYNSNAPATVSAAAAAALASFNKVIQTRVSDSMNVPVFASDGKVTHILHRVEDVTKHIHMQQKVQVEDELRASEIKYRTLLNLLPFAITVSDSLGNIIESNSMAKSMLGICDEKCSQVKINDDKWRFIRTDGRLMPADKYASIRALKENHLVENIEIGLVKEEGATIWLDVSAFPIFLEGYGVMTVYKDISEQRQVKQALQDSKVKLGAALSSMTDAILISDVNGQFIDFNEAFAIFHRFKNKSECAKRLYDYYEIIEMFMANGELATFDMWAVQRAIRGEVVNNAEYTVYRKDTGERWIGSYSFSPIRHKNGEIVGSVVVIRDITEQKMAEKENLKKIADRLKLAIDTLQLGICDWDMSSNVLECDARINEIYGLKNEKDNVPFTFELWKDLIHPDDLNRVLKELSKALKGEKDYGSEFRVVCSDGYVKNIKAIVKVIKNANGVPLHITSIHQDITQQKKTEALLLKTEKLESLGILAGGIAHDFNNLLCGLFGFIELSIHCCESQDYQSIHSLLSESKMMFNRARDLSQQLLTFSKGGAPIVKTQSLIPIIERSSKFIVSGANVILKFDLAEKLWLCNVDENQMGRVIENIIVNAKEAMPNGGIINICVKNISSEEFSSIEEVKKEELEKEGSENKNFVCVKIQDQGTGMAPEHLSKIFDPYFTTKQYGNGLGLATVHSIIKKHEGKIEIVSEQGKGTTVYLYLPAVTNTNTVEKITTKNTKNSDIYNFKYHGKVLIMDDDKNLRKLHSEYFKNFGATVVCAADGDEAIKLFVEAYKTSEPFKLVMLDLTIPAGKGGKETIVEIRKLDSTCIAIASSGYATDPVMSMPTAYGFSDSLAKPYQTKDVIAILRRHGLED